MSRSAHTFLPKKLVAGMGIGAIAILAMAGPALTDDKDSREKRRSVPGQGRLTSTVNCGTRPARSFRLTSAG